MDPDSPPMDDPSAALRQLAERLRRERTVISPHVVDPAEQPVLGPLTAAGARGAEAPGVYSLVIESVREGYLLHYAEPRILAGHDDDLALLAGDYLYACGIEQLASLGDAEAVRELGDLISLSAECHAESRPELVPPLWLAAAIAVGSRGGTEHAEAKESVRRLDPDAGNRLRQSMRSRAASLGLESQLDHAAQSIDLRIPRPDSSG